MFRRIIDFHRKTTDRYLKDHREQMEPWKKKVLKLHELSGFLFYYDNCELEKADAGELVIQGDLARTAVKDSCHLYLYDGRANLLGEGLLLSDPFEKEEKRRGFLRFRKHEFILKILKLQDKDFSGLGQSERKKLLGQMYQDISLISDVLI